jgi:DHA1 family solute carrier family 18 vesicular amine transporter 1/2
MDGVAQVLQNRTKETLRSSSPAMVAAIAFALFLDYFLYGLLFPLLAHSPIGPKSEGQMGVLYGVYAISVLLITPLFGYLGDRIGGRSTMLCGVALEICAILLLCVARDFPLLLIGKFCQGAASAALWTSGLALIAMKYSEKRVEMLGYAFTGSTFGSVIGPIAGGFLYYAGGYQLPFLITGIAFVVAAGMILFLVPGRDIQQNEAVDFRALIVNRSMMVPALAVALAAFSLGTIEPLLLVRLVRYGATTVAIGIIFTVSALAYGMSAPLVGRVSERMPIQKVIAVGTIAMALTLPFLGIFTRVYLIGITASLANVWYAFMLNPASAELGNVADRSGMSCYSAVYAVYNVFYSVGMLATAALVSGAMRLLGFWGVLLPASVILLLSVLVLIRFAAPQSATAGAPDE